MTRPKQVASTAPTARKYDVGRQLSSYQPTLTQPVAANNAVAEPSIAEAAPKRIKWKRLLYIILLVVLIPVIVIGIWDYKNAADASQKLFGSSNVITVLPPNSLDDSDGRTNILLIGYSADDPGHAGAKLTDSIMVVSLNKDKKTGYTLSIPRDLYVDIPNYRPAKINEAYQAGENLDFADPGFPAGGTGLLQKVVTETFELPIHYYVVINYSAVRDITNALGGITVTIASSDERGIYDPNFKTDEGGPLTLTNGVHTLDGQTALRLTRARGSTSGSYGFPQSDFDRTQNQQKVFAAIKAKLSVEQLVDPRINKPLFDAIANNTQTDIGLNQVLPVFSLFRAVPETGLKPINLRDLDGKNYLASYRTSSGQAALVPSAGLTDYSEIIAALNLL